MIHKANAPMATSAIRTSALIVPDASPRRCCPTAQATHVGVLAGAGFIVEAAIGAVLVDGDNPFLYETTPSGLSCRLY